MRRQGIFAVATAVLVSLAAQADAAEYYVDPSAGGAGDGSAGSPWGSLEGALDSGDVGPGDTVWLMSGDYGDLEIGSARNSEAIIVAAADGEEPRFTSVVVRNSSGWTLRGLHVSGESAGYLIELDGDNESVTVESCVLMSTADTSGWSKQDWLNRASDGISVDGTEMTVRNNVVLNVGYGISVSADHSLVEGNLVENFSRDALRGLGDYTVFQYNTVKNCYDVDDHHDDGFQSWSVGPGGVGTGEVVGIVLRGNTIINYEDPNQPHRGTLQGIGCFDGTFVDWVVENNVVVTDHWHGITLLGARNSTVVNNTVVDPNEQDPGAPWIRVADHKNGTPPSGCVVRNNLTTALNNSGSVLEESNIVFDMDETAEFFVDYENNDLRLLEDSAAVDSGMSAGAPVTDRACVPRPQGDGVDVGAYEWHDGTVEAAACDGPLDGPSDGPPGNPPGGTDGTDGGLPRLGSPPDNPVDAGGCGVVRAQSEAGGWLLALLVLAALRRRR